MAEPPQVKAWKALDNLKQTGGPQVTGWVQKEMREGSIQSVISTAKGEAKNPSLSDVERQRAIALLVRIWKEGQ